MNDTSDKTELLVVKTTQRRLLALPLRADNLGPQAGAVWSAITPPRMPSSSDGQRLQLMWNGQREHQVLLDDSSGNVYVVPVYDASLGACRAGTDTDCLTPAASTPGADMLSGLVAASTPATSATALGTLDRLVAPPSAVYESSPTRWILQGLAQGGSEVQDVWTQDTKWTGWYASDLSPGNPPVQGNVASGGRIVSAQRRFPDAGVSTVWTRLDTLASGRKSVEIHLGATTGANGPRPSGVYGFAVPTEMSDAAVPVLNADGSLTLFAPVLESGKVYVKAARLDEVTGLLSGWVYLATSTQAPKTLPDAGPRIAAVEVRETQSCTATSCTQQASYSLVLREGTTDSPRVTSASGKWNTTGDPAFSMTVDSWSGDLGGQALSAPAVSVVPCYTCSNGTTKLLVALNGRDGLFLQYVYVDTTGKWKDDSGYGPAYNPSGTAAKIKTTVSPNLVLDEKQSPQIAVVDTNGQARIGWITDTTRCIGCPVIGPDIAAPAKWTWDLHADDIAGSTTNSLALFAPTTGTRQIVMTNPNNQAIDYSQDTGVAWQPTYTTNTINATTTGNAPDTRSEWNDPHNDAI